IWLSRHSIVYQLLFHAGFGDRVKGEVQIKNAAQLYPSSATSLIIPEANISEASVPKSMLSRLDQNNPSIREGMRITFELMKQMNDICKQNGIQFVVVVIPTKEMVFDRYIEHNPKMPLNDVIDDLLVNERASLQQTFTFLGQNDIRYIDVLPAL